MIQILLPRLMHHCKASQSPGKSGSPGKMVQDGEKHGSFLGSQADSFSNTKDALTQNRLRRDVTFCKRPGDFCALGIVFGYQLPCENLLDVQFMEVNCQGADDCVAATGLP